MRPLVEIVWALAKLTLLIVFAPILLLIGWSPGPSVTVHDEGY